MTRASDLHVAANVRLLVNQTQCRITAEKNHSGSSKSMESEIAMACFNNATNHGLKYSSYTGDEDATTESHVKCRVNYDTAKKTDKNHATRTLGSRLYSAKKTVKGLTF